jgi:tRNA-dihydrouridine synthase B
MKQFASWFTHGVPGGGVLRKQIFESKNGPAVLDAIESFFANRAATPVHEDAVADVDETMLASAAAYCD